MKMVILKKKDAGVTRRHVIKFTWTFNNSMGAKFSAYSGTDLSTTRFLSLFVLRGTAEREANDLVVLTAGRRLI